MLLEHYKVGQNVEGADAYPPFVSAQMIAHSAMVSY